MKQQDLHYTLIAVRTKLKDHQDSIYSIQASIYSLLQAERSGSSHLTLYRVSLPRMAANDKECLARPELMSMHYKES